MTKEMKSLGLSLSLSWGLGSRRYGCGSEGLLLHARGRGGGPGGLLAPISSSFVLMSSSYSTSASRSVSPRRWLVYPTTMTTTTKTAPFGARYFGSSSGNNKQKDESSQKLRNQNHEEREKEDTTRTTITSENGSHARTDGDIKIEYPYSHPPENIPSSSSSSSGKEGKGQASPRTLQAFTLQGNVGVVTGGARGLGLVMGTGMVRSGADLAIVDLNGL